MSQTRMEPDRGPTVPYPGTPRWVKVLGIIAIVLVLLVVVILFTGLGGQHGPGRHLPPIAHGVQQP